MAPAHSAPIASSNLNIFRSLKPYFLARALRASSLSGNNPSKNDLHSDSGKIRSVSEIGKD